VPFESGPSSEAVVLGIFGDDKLQEQRIAALERHVLLCVIGLLAAGCTSHVHHPYSAADAANNNPVIAPLAVQYEPQSIDYHNSILNDDPKREYQLRHIEMRSFGENGQKNDRLESLYYRSNRPRRLPLVIVLPIWGTSTYPPEKIASSLRARSRGGVHVLRVLGEDSIFDWETLGAAGSEEEFLASMERTVLREVVNAVDVSRLIDWAETRPEVDPSRIGLIAFSHGAVVGGLVAVNETRLQGVVLAMGGAHSHRILATCGGRYGKLRSAITERFDWSRDQYERALEPIFMRYDPGGFPGRADPSRILLFDALKDDCIPQDPREALWNALGKPERFSLNYKHRNAFFSMTPLGFYWMRREVYEFLEERLGIGEPVH